MLNYTDILSNSDIDFVQMKSGLGKKHIIKEKVLMHTLKLLEKYNENIILKGGTAINKVYLDEPRFSEDLDYDCLDAGNESMKIKEFLSQYFKVDRRKMHETYRIDCYYNGLSNQTDIVKVEIHQSNNISGVVSKTAKSILFDDLFVGVRTYNLDELTKQKISAFLDRVEGKDFYDLYYILQTNVSKESYIKHKNELLARLPAFRSKLIYSAVSHYLLTNNRYKYNELLDNFESLLKTLK